MNKLEEARKEINEINKEIVNIFERRMKVSQLLAEIKMENNLPIYDPEREKAIIQETEKLVEDEQIRPYLADVMTSFMEASKKYQSRLISKEQVLRINLRSNTYEIYLKHGSLKNVDKCFSLSHRKVLVVTDSGIPEKYIKSITDKCEESYVFTIQSGEKNKNPDTFLNILNRLLDLDFKRTDCVVAIGGGVVGDLSGFAASTYMRGIDFYNVPTTLLAQVDSSVGGKTAIDFAGTKNIVGTFYQPKAVLIDPDVLKTLAPRHLAAGMAEVIKIAALLDPGFFCEIEKLLVVKEKNLKDLDYENIILKSLFLKKNVVEQDEKEKGIRKVLNFGHTIGHGVELVAQNLLHGECISVGMVRMCQKQEVKERLKTLLKSAGLPVCFEADVASVMRAIVHDKKADNGGISCIILDNIGKYHFEDLPLQEVERRLRG